VTGAFIQLASSSAGKGSPWWNDQLAAMRAIGFDTLIVQYVAHDRRSYYPSRIEGIQPSEEDTIQFILDAASEAEVKVFLGLPLDGSFWTGKFDVSARLRCNQATLRELHQRYGVHPALGGWYLPEELSDLTAKRAHVDELLDYLGELTSQAHSLSKLPVMISPYFGQKPDAEAYAVWWDQVALPALGVDIVALQDGVGTRRTTIAQSRPPFAALAPVMKRHGVAFWANNESFYQTAGWPVDEDESGFRAEPTDFDRFLRQVRSTAPFVEKIITFEFTTYMNPATPGGSRQLYRAYKNYFQTTQQREPVSNGREANHR
jgi:hypothetical protein